MTANPRVVVMLALCVAASGCAASSPTRRGTPAPESLVESRGFAGGTQVLGGFTNQASAVLDSTVAASTPTVWSAMPHVFEALEIETTTLDRGTYTIGNASARVSSIAGSRRLSQYLDCGRGIRGANADAYEVTMQLLVRLAPAGMGQTVVRTTLDAYARPRDSGGEPLHCASEGTLERQVLTLISREIALAGSSAAGEAPLGRPSTGAASGTGPVVTPTFAPMSAGRIPRTGDLLRIECLSSVDGSTLVGEGRFVGAGEASVRMLMDMRGRTVAVPSLSVRAVEVRERRDYRTVVGVLGFVAGATIGGLYASSRYDPDAGYHFRPEVITTVGAVAGGLGGGLVGMLTGSLFRSDTWHDAAPEWALRTSGVDPVLASAEPLTLCPGF